MMRISMPCPRPGGHLGSAGRVTRMPTARKPDRCLARQEEWMRQSPLARHPTLLATLRDFRMPGHSSCP